MTRARILADYVSSGDELALKAPLASPAFTGTPTGITAAHITSGVLPVGVTGGSGLTALGTVTAGNLSNSAIVYPAGHVLETQLESITSGSEQGITFSNLQLGSTITFASVGAGETIVAWALGGNFVCKHSNKSSMNSLASIGIGASGDEEIISGGSGSTGGGLASHDIDVRSPGATAAVREYSSAASDVLIKLYIQASTAGGWNASSTQRIYLHAQRVKGTVL